MFPIVRTVLQSLTRARACTNTVSLFHSLNTVIVPQNTLTSSFLMPTSVSFTPSCGLKVKGFLKRRCKDCFFAKRFNRLYVLCPTHPRHKQMQVAKREKNTWILTHATQGKIRPW